jgi:hypothetical protein
MVLITIGISVTFGVFSSAFRLPANAQSESPSPAPVKRALLIGIDKYQSENIPELRGAVNDVEAAAQLLMTRFGFRLNSIRRLINENATRRAILEALNELAKVSGPRDWIYIHYSGHGSQVDDLNGDEKDDQKDETLVPYDGRTGNIPDIIDDELGDVLGKFISPNVVVVLDACHSGTATRGVTVRSRSIPEDTRKEIYRQLQPTTRAIIPLTAQHHILLSGAAAGDLTLDGPIDGQNRGIFSYALQKTLATAEMNVSVRDLIIGIESELNRIKGQMGLVDMPEPQVEAEGNRINGSLFEVNQAATSAKTQSMRPWIEVQTIQKGRILLKNGALMGATVGSTWLIYPAGEMGFAPGKGIAAARVVALQGRDAEANLQPAAQDIPQGCRAVAVAPGPATKEIPVLITIKSGAPRLNIRQELQKIIPDLKFVGPGDFARFIIEIAEQRCQIFGMAGLTPIDDFKLTDMAEAIQRITRQLMRAVASADLLSLENATASIRVEVSIPEQITASLGKSSRDIRVATNTEAPRFRVRKTGEARNNANSLQLQLRVSEDSYITIVDVDQEGGINLLFPNEIQGRDFYPNGKVKGGETVLVPDTLGEGNRARFNFDISLPHGIDTIRVFATKEPSTAEMIRQFIRNLNQLPGEQRGGLPQGSPFGQLRRDLVRVAVNRGIKVTSNHDGKTPFPDSGAADDWNAASLTIVVEDANKP